jgi:hypothetical protein
LIYSSKLRGGGGRKTRCNGIPSGVDRFLSSSKQLAITSLEAYEGEKLAPLRTIQIDQILDKPPACVCVDWLLSSGETRILPRLPLLYATLSGSGSTQTNVFSSDSDGTLCNERGIQELSSIMLAFWPHRGCVVLLDKRRPSLHYPDRIEKYLI